MRIVMVGRGRMAQAVLRVAKQRGHEVPGIIHRQTPLEERQHLAHRADVLVDFSHSSAIEDVVTLALEAGRPLVTGTTGWDDQLEAIRRRVEEAGGSMLYAPNFSIAVELFMRSVLHLAKGLARMEGFDLAIEEIHHRHKVDAPSGTAWRLGRRLLEVLPFKRTLLARLPDGERIPGDALVVSALRLGEEFGTHRVYLETPYDRIEVTHRARSREGFAYGAVRAAEWLPEHPGFWRFEEVLEAILNQTHRAVS